MKAPDYPDRLAQLEARRAAPVLRCRWPAEVPPLALEAALAACGESPRARDWARDLEATRALLAMLGRPIIAVFGQLNAGKSSVVATFLSPAGRQRVPRGEEEEKGTHRFVYWVPSSWLAEDAAREAFFGLLDAVHGRQRELLAEDPETAAAQYRSGRDDPAKLSIPLVAGDPALDVLGAALLDCPDVQTHDAGSALTAGENRRLEMLVQAAQICSAFLVVWLRAMVRDGLLDRMLTEVRRRLATAPLFLLLNKIEPEPGQPARTRSDRDVAALLHSHAIAAEAVFGAFNFKIEAHQGAPGWREFTPPALVERFAVGEERLPQFFQLGTDGAAHRPEAIPPGHFLTALPARLDLADLQQRKMADAWGALGRFTRECATTLRVHRRAQERQAETLHAGLLALCVAELSDATTGEARQVLSPEFADGFAHSLRRSAPWWVWAAMQGARPINWAGSALRRKISEAKRLLGLLGDLHAGQLPRHTFREKIAEVFAREFPDQELALADADSLAARMKTLRWVPAELAEPQLAAGWTAVLANFRRYPLEVDAAELDRMTGGIWQALGFWQKLKFSAKNFLAAVGGLVAVAGALVVLVDGGATMFATISLTSWLAAILPGKLMLAAVAAGGATLGASLLLSSIKVNTLPYLARFFALAADAFGVPRTVRPGALRVEFGPRKNPQSHELPAPAVPMQETICRLAPLRLWDEAPALAEIEQLFTP